MKDKSKVFKNTVMLYIMSFAKIVLPLITLPYLTRVLSVDNYGIYTYEKTIMTYMQLVIDFGFLFSATKDIVSANGDKSKIGLITGNTLFAKLILSVLSFSFLLILLILIPILRENFLFTFLSFIPVFLTVFLFDFLFRGIEKMQIITIRYVLMKGISTFLTFILIKNNSDFIFIPILDIVGTFIAIIWVFDSIKKMNIKIYFGSIREVIKEIKISAIYFLSDVVSTVFGALNTLIVGLILCSRDIAYFGLVSQLVAAIQILYTPIINGVYPEMVRNKSLKLIKKIIYIFMPLILLGNMFVFFGAKWILLIIGGSKYTDAAPILRLMIPVLIFSFPEMLFGWPVLGVINKVKENTITSVEASILQIGGIFFLIISKNFSLKTITILRGITEFTLFFIRFRIFWKNRDRFSN